MPPVLRSLLLVLALTFLFAGCASPGPGSGAAVPAVDLTRQAWFPPVVPQQSFSCSQQVAIYYLLTSEWNRRAGRSSAPPGQRFSPYFSYSLLAGEQSGRSHVVDGWIVARETGVPLAGDFPRYSRTLMHGYDRYLRAMSHRVENWEVLRVADGAGISRARELLAAGHPLACDFQIRGTQLQSIAPGQPRAGEKIVKQWGRSGPGHAMVYAGYDDTVGFDFNGDGAITSDRDITGDGAVTLADQERGAFLVINPWGGAWGNRGRAWAPYREHALSSWPWARSVATVTAAPQAEHPRLTLKLRLLATSREHVIVTAGNDRGRSVEPWIFSHRPVTGGSSGTLWDSFTSLRTPGPHLSPGPLAAPGGGALETGHDLTALGTASGYTLTIRPSPGRALQGRVEAASFLEYDSFGRLLREVPVAGLPAALPPGGGTWGTR